MKFKEYRNMISIQLRNVILPDTVTNKGSQVTKGLVDDLIKKYERGKISVLEFVPNLGYRYKKE
jgi:hypothetical protein